MAEGAGAGPGAAERKALRAREGEHCCLTILHIDCITLKPIDVLSIRLVALRSRR